MNIGVIGSGIVGQTVGKKLVDLGHVVMIGTRDPQQLDEAKGFAGSLRAWLASVSDTGRIGTFADAAAFGELVINATSGQASLDALHQAGAANLDGKVLIDIANELDGSHGMPPRSLAVDGDSLAEKIQRTFPQTKVVKTLNTMSAFVMVKPELVGGGDSTVFLSGNDGGAKEDVATLLRSIGWKDILDLGDITTARGTEMLMPLWLRVWMAVGNIPFNIKVVR